MNLVTVISSVIDGGVQLVKFLRYGKSDVQEKKTVSPYGIDSNPIKDMIGLYVKTSQLGDEVLVGYICKASKALSGEIIVFSTDDNGSQKAYLHFKKDGLIHFNGDDDNMVRFSKLEEGFNELKGDYNDFIDNIWNQFATGYVAGGPTVQGQPLTLITQVMPQSTASIADAKIEKILTYAED